jgi:hypothetical protein
MAELRSAQRIDWDRTGSIWGSLILNFILWGVLVLAVLMLLAPAVAGAKPRDSALTIGGSGTKITPLTNVECKAAWPEIVDCIEKGSNSQGMSCFRLVARCSRGF